MNPETHLVIGARTSVCSNARILTHVQIDPSFNETLNVLSNMHPDHEPARIIDRNCRRGLPLPKGEGSGEGEQDAQILPRFRIDQRERVMARGNGSRESCAARSVVASTDRSDTSLSPFGIFLGFAIWDLEFSP
jgi:hypothetical protein